jgi:hypothetical protein
MLCTEGSSCLMLRPAVQRPASQSSPGRTGLSFWSTVPAWAVDPGSRPVEAGRKLRRLADSDQLKRARADLLTSGVTGGVAAGAVPSTSRIVNANETIAGVSSGGSRSVKGSV